MSGVVDELYKRLNTIAGQMTQELGRPVSMREALLRMFKSMDPKPSDFAWSSRIRETRVAERRQRDLHKRS